MTGLLLHLLRHGAPFQSGRFLGHVDVEPTAAGIAACAKQASDLPFDRVIASDLSRAVQAAFAISQARRLPLIVDPRWRELDFGAWDGLAASDIDAEALQRFWSDPDGHPPPGGEPWSALTERVAAAIGELTPRSTLVVTHGGAIRAALSTLCGFTLPQLWSFEIGHAALITLKLWRGDDPSAQIVGLWPCVG